MTEDTDKLLKTFFAENRQEIADNGFSRRVMRRLPNGLNHLASLWTGLCFVLAVVLFVCMDGLQLIGDTLRETWNVALESSLTQADPKSLIIAGLVLLYFIYRKIASLA